MFTLRQPSIPVVDGRRFPVRRIFCIGKNYADHAIEMGSDPKSEPPVFFTKPADAACSAREIPFPLATDDLHYEAELVVGIGAGGTALSDKEAAAAIVGYACGCDLTRRDLQAEAKERRAPWDLAKAFDDSAMVGKLMPRNDVLTSGSIELKLNGETRQSADLADMIWSVPEILSRLSRYFELRPGDLVYTGTPAGVGALQPEDHVEIAIADLPPLRFTLLE